MIQGLPWGLSLLQMKWYSEAQPPEVIYTAYRAIGFFKSNLNRLYSFLQLTYYFILPSGLGLQGFVYVCEMVDLEPKGHLGMAIFHF